MSVQLRQNFAGARTKGDAASNTDTASALFESRQGRIRRTVDLRAFPPSRIGHHVQVKELGIVLGHGSNAADWSGKFFTELAAALAAEGDNC